MARDPDLIDQLKYEGVHTNQAIGHGVSAVRITQASEHIPGFQACNLKTSIYRSQVWPMLEIVNVGRREEAGGFFQGFCRTASCTHIYPPTIYLASHIWPNGGLTGEVCFWDDDIALSPLPAYPKWFLLLPHRWLAISCHSALPQQQDKSWSGPKDGVTWLSTPCDPWQRHRPHTHSDFFLHIRVLHTSL